MQRWENLSSNGHTVYVTQVEANGRLSCDCPGWTVKKVGKVRECKHTKKAALENHLQLEERDEQWFVTGYAATPLPPPHTPAPGSMTDQGGAPRSFAPVPNVVGEKVEWGKFIEPMLAAKMPDGKTVDDFDPLQWAMEEKYDGHRLIVAVQDQHSKAWSRLNNQRTLPDHIKHGLTGMPNGVYDGEIIIPGMHSSDVVAGANAGNEVLVLFDVLELFGQSVIKEKESRRRALLVTAHAHIGSSIAVRLAEQFPPSLAKVQAIWRDGGEGAMLKKLDSPYQPGYRSGYWVKVKAIAAATLTVTGFKAGESGPYSALRLIDDSADQMETTVKTLDNRTLREIAANPDSFIGKRLVISYQEKTKTGNYRHPMFDHWAGDSE